MNTRVEVLVRADCAACSAAVADVSRICGELGVGWSTVDVDSADVDSADVDSADVDSADIDSGRELRAEYGDRVPVILVDGREHGFWSVDEPRLRAALA